MTSRWLYALSALLLLGIPALAQDRIEATIYRNEKSIILIIRDASNISLDDLNFEVTRNDETKRYSLGDYPAFAMSAPYIQGTACFNLVGAGEDISVPLDCQQADALFFTQDLNAADVFWARFTTGEEFTFVVYYRDALAGICPAGNDTCPLIIPESPAPVDDTPAPPAGDQVTFVSYRDGDAEIYSVNTTDLSLEKITSNDKGEFEPFWSPDGSQIAYQAEGDTPDNSEIFALNLATGEERNISNFWSLEFAPRWAPDGKTVAYVSYRAGGDIFLTNLQTGDTQNLTNHPATYLLYAWSPDSSKLAFSSNWEGDYEVYVIELASGTVTQLTDNDIDDLFPAWSPDGKEIAYAVGPEGSAEIYVMNVDGTSARNVSNNSADDTRPAWSPDGSQLAFMSTRDGNWEIYMMDANGSNVVRLTNDAGDDVSPVWRPQPPSDN